MRLSTNGRFLAAVVVGAALAAGCGAGAGDTSGASAVSRGATEGDPAGATAGDPPRVLPADPRHSSCMEPEALVPGAASRVDALGGTETQTACLANGAPQRFYLVTVPPGASATVRVVPITPTLRVVVGVLRECGADKCDGFAVSSMPGTPTGVSVSNDDSAPMYRVVTVSGLSRGEIGTYDISVELTSSAAAF